MKVVTMQENVLKYGQKEGAVLDVSEEVAKHLIDTGMAKEHKETKKAEPKEEKKEAPKKKTTKKKD